MERKHFLSTVLGAGASIPLLGSSLNIGAAPGSPIIPPYLQNGDWIGVTSPAGYITVDEVKPAAQQIQDWGLRIRLGDTIGKRDFTFGGTDAERAADLQQMLDDDSLKAILCARGGYGSVRIVDSLDFTRFMKNPKWIIGFSDITVLHSHLNRNCNIASIHSKMCNSFPDDWNKAEPIQVETILSIKKALFGGQMSYTAIPNEKNKKGTVSGVLVGGNLKTLESLAGSRSDINTKGKILFVEDTGEYLYSIDRMFWGLKRTGKLEGLKALVVGGFKIKPDDDPSEAFGKSLYDIVLEKCADYNFPICFDFPVGHQKNNYALKCGVMHRLEVKDEGVELKELL